MRDDEDDWGKYLNSAVFSINTSLQSSTKVTPFRMMFGREARFPCKLRQNLLKKLFSRFQWQSSTHWPMKQNKLIADDTDFTIFTLWGSDVNIIKKEDHTN